MAVCLFALTHPFSVHHIQTQTVKEINNIVHVTPMSVVFPVPEMCSSPTALLGFSRSMVPTTDTTALDIKETAAEWFMNCAT